MPYLVCEGNEDYEPGESPICHNSMCYLGLCTSIVDHMQYMGELTLLHALLRGSDIRFAGASLSRLLASTVDPVCRSAHVPR